MGHEIYKTTGILLFIFYRNAYMRYQSAPVSSEETQETTAQRAARQRQERRAELTYSTDDYKRWNNNKNKTLDERNKEKQKANVTEAATEQKLSLIHI